MNEWMNEWVSVYYNNTLSLCVRLSLCSKETRAEQKESIEYAETDTHAHKHTHTHTHTNIRKICEKEWVGFVSERETENGHERKKSVRAANAKKGAWLNYFASWISFLYSLFSLSACYLWVSGWSERASERANKQASAWMNKTRKNAHTHTANWAEWMREINREYGLRVKPGTTNVLLLLRVCVCVCEYCFCLMFLYFAHNWSSNTTACFFFVSLCVCVRAYFRIVKLFLPFTSKKMKSERENKKISNTNNTTPPPPPPPPSSSSSPSTANAQYIPVFILYYLCVSGRANEWKYAYAFEPNAGKFITLSTQRAQEGERERERKGILYFRA